MKAASATKSSRVLHGLEKPRLFTPPARALGRHTTKGYEFLEWVSANTSWVPLPWQKWLAYHALEINADGTYRFKEIILLVSRQNGKSEFLAYLAAWWMAQGIPLIVASSAQVDTARDAWETTVDVIEDLPSIFGKAKTRRANGDWKLSTPLTKSNYKIVGATRKGGRGLTIHMAIEDEFREHYNDEAHAAISGATMAVSNSQIWMCSNAGDIRSVLLNDYRETALSNTVPDLGIFEWSAPDGCEIDDRNAWRQANPSMGYFISEETLIRKMATFPPSKFRTEFLCQGVPALDEAINSGQWANCLDPGSLSGHDKARLAAFLEVSQDLKHATLCVAAKLPNGKVRVEVARDWTDLATLRTELPEWVKKVSPRLLGYFPNGPSAAIAVDLRGLKNLKEMPGGSIVEACMGFAEQVAAKQLVHSGQEGLTQQLLQARRVKSGDGWKFERPGYDSVHVDTAYAAAGAVLLARQIPDKKPFTFMTAPSDNL